MVAGYVPEGLTILAGKPKLEKPLFLDWDLGTKMFEAKLPDRGRSSAHAKCSHEKADYACEAC
jgi:hypothetical protein